MGIAAIIVILILVALFVKGRGSAKTAAQTITVAEKVVNETPKIAAKAVVVGLDQARKGHRMALVGSAVAKAKGTEFKDTVKAGAENWNAEFKTSLRQSRIDAGLIEAPKKGTNRRQRNKKGGRTTESTTAKAKAVAKAS